ncbi:MAG TPA: SAM-dependent methyltransferase [Candidatus Limnocylindrales bacterium]|nr:SAM-dependent methyltransferase [Candidatus Limnocylindrales bacterium]
MTDLRPELRRDGPTDLSDVGEDTALVERIRDEARRSGPMPFARFMDLVLYDPDGGYYRSHDARPGRGGDFLTAPELHPIFGEMLARAVVQAWERLERPDPFIVVEHGAGEGALATSLLDAVRVTPLAGSIRYRPVEVDEGRMRALRDRLETAGLADRLEGGPPDAPFDGIVLANEVLDALPVHRVRQVAGELRELAVAVRADGAFGEVEIAPSTAALAERLAAEEIELVEGQTAEICLVLDDWIARASAPLRRGLVLLIDYGAIAAELYDPMRRRGGTLRAYVRHQVHDDPYRFVGRQDLTAHVDVTAVQRAAVAAGLTTIGITTQAEALMGLGIEERLREIQADPATIFEDYTLLRSALLRLLDPAAMGRFRFMVFGRDWPAGAGLDMLGYRLPGRPGRPTD